MNPIHSLPDQTRRLLVESLLVVPSDMQEKFWLVEFVRKSKKSASQDMDTWDAAETWTYYEIAKKRLDYWLEIEAELCLSLGYEHCFESEQIERIHFRLNESPSGYGRGIALKAILENTIDLVVDGENLLSRALAEAREESDDFGEAERQELERLETVVPLAWGCLQQLARLPKAAAQIPSDLLYLIEHDSRSAFIERYRADQEWYLEQQKRIEGIPVLDGVNEVEFPRSLIDYDDALPF